MSAYSFGATGAYTSALAGGNMTPAFPTFSAGNLGLLETGANSTTLGSPAITGWTLLTPNVNAKCASLYGRILQGGDTSPTFQWDSTHQAYSRISVFGGDVPSTITGIVAVSSDRGTNATGAIAVSSIAVPSAANCLVIRGGHCVKTATNNGSAFGDWQTNSGIFTKIGNTQLVQGGTALAAALWYDQETNATGFGSDSVFLTNTDTSGNSQGFVVMLFSAQNTPIGMQAL